MKISVYVITRKGLGKKGKGGEIKKYDEDNGTR